MGVRLNVRAFRGFLPWMLKQVQHDELRRMGRNAALIAPAREAM
jgi:hypothetical protein